MHLQKIGPVLGFCLALATVAPQVLAQQQAEPTMEQLERALKRPDWVVLGMNFWPTRATEIQVNFVHPVEGIHENQLLVNAQIGF